MHGNMQNKTFGILKFLEPISVYVYMHRKKCNKCRPNLEVVLQE